MSPNRSSIRALGRAVLIAVILGGGGLAAAPVLAQQGPAMNFNLGAGDGRPSAEFGTQGNDNRSFRRGGNSNDFRRSCLTDRQVIRGLSRYGFSRIDVRSANRGSARVIARYGRFDYLMRVDKCSGEVNIVDRYRRRGGNGFGLQFGT